MLHDYTHNQTRTSPSFVTSLLERHAAWRWHVAALLSIGLIAVGLALVAERVSAHETVRIGTVLDTIYVTDGFYDRERSAEHGPYRWTHPLALLTLRDWGPGRVHVSISGIGAAASEALLKIDGESIAHTTIQPGQAWTVQGWGTSGSRDPVVTLEGPSFQPPGDARTLGRLVTELDIYAPEARMRAWLNLGLLCLAGILLYAAMFLWFMRPCLALTVGVSLPAVFGPLAVYRDRWMDTVAWVAPLTLLILLAVTWRRGVPTGGAQHSAQHSRWATTLACVGLTAALLLLAQGFYKAFDPTSQMYQMTAFDSERMYQMAGGLAEYGLPTRYPGRETWTKYGFGQSLLAVPFYWLGKLGVALGGDYNRLTRFAVSLTNLPLAALTCWLIYRAGRRFAPIGVSLAVAATYLLTTPALNYARTFFSEPAGAALLLVSCLLIIPKEGERAPNSRRIVLAGACLGAMILFKPAFVIFWLAPGLAVLALAARQESGVRGQGSGVRSAAWVKRVVTAGLLFSIGPVVAAFVQLGYNYLRYWDVQNGLFRTGYEREPGFSTPLFEGLGGLLFSPGKSLFLYAPVLLLAPFGLWLMYRRGGSYGGLTATLILAQTAVSLIFNALWWAWTGNFAWGPRLIMPVLPLLAWPLASVGNWALQAGGGQRVKKAMLGLWLALAVLGGLVSIPGALVDFQVYYRLYGLALAGDPGEEVTIYSPADSPLLVEPGYLLDGVTASIRRPSLSEAGLPGMWDVLVPASLTMVALLATWMAARMRRQE